MNDAVVLTAPSLVETRPLSQIVTFKLPRDRLGVVAAKSPNPTAQPPRKRRRVAQPRPRRKDSLIERYERIKDQRALAVDETPLHQSPQTPQEQVFSQARLHARSELEPLPQAQLPTSSDFGNEQGEGEINAQPTSFPAIPIPASVPQPVCELLRSTRQGRERISSTLEGIRQIADMQSTYRAPFLVRPDSPAANILRQYSAMHNPPETGAQGPILASHAHPSPPPSAGVQRNPQVVVGRYDTQDPYYHYNSNLRDIALNHGTDRGQNGSALRLSYFIADNMRMQEDGHIDPRLPIFGGQGVWNGNRGDGSNDVVDLDVEASSSDILDRPRNADTVAQADFAWNTVLEAARSRAEGVAEFRRGRSTFCRNVANACVLEVQWREQSRGRLIEDDSPEADLVELVVDEQEGDIRTRTEPLNLGYRRENRAYMQAGQDNWRTGEEWSQLLTNGGQGLTASEQERIGFDPNHSFSEEDVDRIFEQDLARSDPWPKSARLGGNIGGVLHEDNLVHGTINENEVDLGYGIVNPRVVSRV